MSEENTLRTLRTFTVKTEEETVNRFKTLKEQLGIATDSQMLTELLDRLEQPQKVNDRTKALQQQLEEASRKYDGEHAINEQLNTKIADLQHQLEEANGTANHNAEEANRQQLEMQQQIDSLTLKENQAVISFTPDNLKVLDLVCARESSRRQQSWSRSHVINYFINARFVRGLLNGDLQSVSDSELRRLGISLKNPGKEDFEL